MRRLIPALLAISQAATAQSNSATIDTAKTRVLESVTVSGRIDDLTGAATSASQGRIGWKDLRSRPIARDGELLETIPGMIVTQHSGEGKAGQYFVRGFNLDHGTDFLTRVDGMPVNLPSHAHGQGWTDLNFLIPETVDHLEYSLGNYNPEFGDFGSAGAAEFHLFKKIGRPFAALSAGENGFRRAAAGASRPLGSGDFFSAAELKKYDGPWTLPQNLRKLSAMSRYSVATDKLRFSVLGMAYDNRWDATDQIPDRAVTGNLIGRFGHLDRSNGGNTSRYSLSTSMTRIAKSHIDNASVYAIYSSLDLYSNFTYFLNDSTRGDQFNQRDRRAIVGARIARDKQFAFGQISHSVKVGAETRADFISPAGLFLTEERQRYATIREDSIRQLGAGLFVSAASAWTPWLRTVVGQRIDFYDVRVRSSISSNSGKRSAYIISPKGSVILTPGVHSEIYLSAGTGFHSNDARGTTITVDPVTLTPAERVDPLVRSRGGEIGLRVSPLRNLRSTLAVWALALNSELVFTGDGGSTEPSAASRRSGVTWANFYRPTGSLSLDADISFARARFTGVNPGETRIPGALENVVAAGIAFTPARGIGGSLRLRHFGAYPLTEDNSLRARSATLLNGEAVFGIGRARIRGSLLNVLDAHSYDIQYAYTSRLRGESIGGVEDVHFHPVEPRQLRLALELGF